MGKIKQDVQELFFSTHFDHLEYLKPFLFCFGINYAAKRESANTTLFTFILEADGFLRESFGFEKEVMLVYSPYDTMEPRSLQALSTILKEFPFSSRVDSLTCFLVSSDANISEWLQSASLGGVICPRFMVQKQC